MKNGKDRVQTLVNHAIIDLSAILNFFKKSFLKNGEKFTEMEHKV
jgi:hypothetical protein